MVMAKEKLTEEIRVMVQPSLYASFKKACEQNYKTISEVIRDYMANYVSEEKENGSSERS
jgi:metal-responsive CopG/Arc/MetJ family transcriptional regulator